MAKEFKVTSGRKVLLNALVSGAKKWSELRLAYFGPARGKSKSTTAFHVQLTNMVQAGIIDKGDGVYNLSTKGTALVAKLAEDGISIEGSQSQAQANFIAPEPKVEAVDTPLEEAQTA